MVTRSHRVVQSSVTVLAYHRVEAPGAADLAPTLIEASPKQFEAQMRFVAARFNVISAWDLVRALQEDYTLPKRALLITFDDGYNSFRDNTLPVLNRLGLPVTLFVSSNFAGTPGALFWWDELYRALRRTPHTQLEVPGFGHVSLETPAEREAAFEHLVPLVERQQEQAAAKLIESVVSMCGVEPNTAEYLLNWEDLRALAADGVAIGAHSRSHIILSQASRERLWSEVDGSWADVKAHIDRPLPLFCYPNGKPHALSPMVVDAVARAGLVGAFTMIGGVNTTGQTNPYLLHRMGLEPGESMVRFVLKLTPAARLYRTTKRLVRRAIGTVKPRGRSRTRPVR
jgi:peptidoglycan/xylan/chitin deacetylase (PgdA/CDA1 family)